MQQWHHYIKHLLNGCCLSVLNESEYNKPVKQTKQVPQEEILLICIEENSLI